jgi:hypothetical protein
MVTSARKQSCTLYAAPHRDVLFLKHACCEYERSASTLHTRSLLLPGMSPASQGCKRSTCHFVWQIFNAPDALNDGDR